MDELSIILALLHHRKRRLLRTSVSFLVLEAFTAMAGVGLAFFGYVTATAVLLVVLGGLAGIAVFSVVSALLLHALSDDICKVMAVKKE